MLSREAFKMAFDDKPFMFAPLPAIVQLFVENVPA
jgi:hypothetical protein